MLTLFLKRLLNCCERKQWRLSQVGDLFQEYANPFLDHGQRVTLFASVLLCLVSLLFPSLMLANKFRVLCLESLLLLCKRLKVPLHLPLLLCKALRVPRTFRERLFLHAKACMPNETLIASTVLLELTALALSLNGLAVDFDLFLLPVIPCQRILQLLLSQAPFTARLRVRSPDRFTADQVHKKIEETFGLSYLP